MTGVVIVFLVIVGAIALAVVAGRRNQAREHERKKTELEPVYPGYALPGGLLALFDGRDRKETPVYLPEQRALVFADGLTAPHGELLVWHTPWHEERALPALRKLLELPFERVLVSHGEPVHTRADYEAALERDPYRG